MNFEEATDELYAAAPEAFVAERSRLAKALKAAGHTEDAKALAQLRKPSLAAAALNELARRAPDELAALREAGRRLRDAQAAVLRGAEPGLFDAARREESAIVARLVRAASTGEPASAATLVQVESSLREAARSDEAGAELARGQLVAPLAAEGFGFELVAALAPVVPAARRPRSPAASPQPGEPSRGGARPSAARSAGTEPAGERPSVARGERAGREQARAELRQAREHLRGAREALREAERGAREAERRAAGLEAETAKARARAEAANAVRARAADAVTAAERALAPLPHAPGPPGRG